MRLVRWFPPLYNDWTEGGRALAGAVAALALEEPVVVGVARGGVAVAVEVARALDAPLTAVDVERVNARGLRLGAVTAAGPAYVHENHRVPEHEVRVALERARRAAEILEARLGPPWSSTMGSSPASRSRPPAAGRTRSRSHAWSRPVAHVAGLARVREEADDVVCPSPLEEIAVVGQAYDSVEPLDEWYVAGPPRRMTLVIIDAENVRRSPWPNLSGEAGGTGGRRRSARFKSRGSSWTVSRTSTHRTWCASRTPTMRPPASLTRSPDPSASSPRTARCARALAALSARSPAEGSCEQPSEADTR